MILFSLFLKGDINEDGTIKEGAAGRAAASVGAGADGDTSSEVHNEEESLKEAREKLATSAVDSTSQDDVD